VSHRQPITAREKILAVHNWALSAGYHNIAAELADVLALMPNDTGDSRERARRILNPRS